MLLAAPDNQVALTTLLLAVTDQLETEFAAALDEAKVVLQQIQGDYEQAYYEGIIDERWAKAQLAQGLPPGIRFWVVAQGDAVL